MRVATRRPKGNKFGAKKVRYEGKTFDSIMEKDYYIHLGELKEQGIIKSFEWQVPFLLQDSFKFYDMKREKETTVRKIEYIADYVIEYNDGTTHVVDVKGLVMDVFRMKFKVLKKVLLDSGHGDYRVYCVKKLRNKWVIF